jgi:Family of unknown function (DUF5681)
MQTKPKQQRKDGDVGYKRPPKQFQFKKGVSGNPSGLKRDIAGSRVPDLRRLLQLALNSRFRRGERRDVITQAAAGIEQLVAQFAAGDRHARRDVIALAEKLGVDLAAGHGAIERVVTAALAAEDDAIITNFLRRHGVAPQQKVNTVPTPAQEKSSNSTGDSRHGKARHA